MSMFQDIKNGRFYLGDCLEVMKEIPDGVVDMILCDLPYGTTACSWDSIIPFEPLWEQYNRVCKENAVMVFTATQPFSSSLVMSNPENYRYSFYWRKHIASGYQNAKKQPMRDIEECLVFYRKFGRYFPQGLIEKKTKRINKVNAAKSIVGGKEGAGGLRTQGNEWEQTHTNYPKSCLEINGVTRGKIHPTQKPVELFEYLIRTYTNEGDLVLDNCAGSGTTAIAAENCGRKWVCIEQLEEYANKAVERILNHAPEVKPDLTIQIENDITNKLRFLNDSSSQLSNRSS